MAQFLDHRLLSLSSIYCLLVNLEAVPAVLQVSYHLVGGGQAGVDVGLGGLGTHLLRGEQHALGILGLELVGIGGLHVSHIA